MRSWGQAVYKERVKKMRSVSIALSLLNDFLRNEDGVSTMEWVIILGCAAAMCTLVLAMGDKTGSPDRVKSADNAIKNGFSGIEHNLPGRG